MSDRQPFAAAPTSPDQSIPACNQTEAIEGMISDSRVDEDGRTRRRTGGSGGSAQTIPSRRREVSRKLSPIDRARGTIYR
ncbi:hypothetical protein GN244_ATG13889 [Phytophthora infestans]|uniref:Uncharacterized protein n=1 Tax=Phytophthora infestans TaxID=4787 RepID=A0A833WGX6_PHYIN|nr:hypothetical protein GN244_ATG13889 [Phytophthora infestans]